MLWVKRCFGPTVLLLKISAELPRCSIIAPSTAKLARTPQVDDQSLQADTGSPKFTQPADQEGDEFHLSALKCPFTAEDSGREKPCGGGAAVTLLVCLIICNLLGFLSRIFLPVFSLSDISIFPPRPFYSSSSLLLRSQPTKSWMAGINSHQQITDLSVASFPEICNTLHMGAKCFPDARVHVLSRPCCLHSQICALSSKIVLSHTLLPLWVIYIVYEYISILFPMKIQRRLWLLKPADSCDVLIRHCLRKWKSVPAGAVETLLICMCNQ